MLLLKKKSRSFLFPNDCENGKNKFKYCLILAKSRARVGSTGYKQTNEGAASLLRWPSSSPQYIWWVTPMVTTSDEEVVRRMHPGNCCHGDDLPLIWRNDQPIETWNTFYNYMDTCLISLCLKYGFGNVDFPFKKHYSFAKSNNTSSDA